MDGANGANETEAAKVEKLAHFKPQKGRPYAVIIKGERVLISSVPKDGRPAILVELEAVEGENAASVRT